MEKGRGGWSSRPFRRGGGDEEREHERGADSPRRKELECRGESLEKRSMEGTAEVDRANYNFPIKTSVEEMLPRRRIEEIPVEREKSNRGATSARGGLLRAGIRRVI